MTATFHHDERGLVRSCWWITALRRQERWQRRRTRAAGLPQSLIALLMTAKGESALEIGEEELPALHRLPPYKWIASAYKWVDFAWRGKEKRETRDRGRQSGGARNQWILCVLFSYILCGTADVCVCVCQPPEIMQASNNEQIEPLHTDTHTHLQAACKVRLKDKGVWAF